MTKSEEGFMSAQLTLEQAKGCGMNIAYHAAQRPAQMAVSSRYGDRTFAELNNRINQLVRVLRGAGLKPDDGVAMLLRNRPEFVEVYFACQRAGLRVTPINWHLTGDNAAYVVGNCEACVFIADSHCAVPALEALRSNCKQLVLALAVGGAIEGFEDYEQLLLGQPTADIDDPVVGSQMLYTSGTTGRPKGVYRPRVSAEVASNIPASQFELDAAMNPESDCSLCAGPAYHAAPLAFNVVLALNNGVGVVFMDQWDAREALVLIDRHRVSHTHMVATMFHRLLALDETIRSQYDLSSLRYLLHGAAPCPVHVKQRMIEWLGPVVYEYYAATEGGGGFNINSQQWLAHPGSVGKAPATADNKVCDDDGREVAVGVVGTLYFKAPPLRFEYFKDSDKTAGSYLGDYFTLGDMGYVDAEGYLFLTGRSAETIISGGVNIYPQETDDALLKHPAVADVCSIGVPNDEWGEEIKSLVQLHEGHVADEHLAVELIGFVRSQLASFKSPKTIDFVELLPRLPSGKIQRKLLREPFWAGRDRQI